MARKPMVTRTIVTNKVTVLCLDTEKAEPMNATLFVPSTVPADDEKKVLKYLTKVMANDPKYANIVPTKVVAKEHIEKLYGMDEDYFIAHAVELPPRAVKE